MKCQPLDFRFHMNWFRPSVDSKEKALLVMVMVRWLPWRGRECSKFTQILSGGETLDSGLHILVRTQAANGEM